MKFLTTKEKKTLIRYTKSSIVTFLTGFGFGILPMLSELSVDNINKAFIVGVLFAGFRAGIKAVAELLGKIKK